MPIFFHMYIYFDMKIYFSSLLTSILFIYSYYFYSVLLCIGDICVKVSTKKKKKTNKTKKHHLIKCLWLFLVKSVFLD